MRLSRLVLAATLALASAGTTTAFAQAKNAGREKLVADFIAAFNKGDAKAVAALYTEGSIRISQTGKEIGRAAIEKALVANFAGPFKGTKLTVTDGASQALTADIEVVEGSYSITGAKAPDGKPLPAQTGYYVNTNVKKGGAWLIAGSATFPPAPPAPAPAKK